MQNPTVVWGTIFTQMTGSGVSYRKTKPTSHAHVAAPVGGLGAVWQLILNQIPPRARNPQPNPEKRAQNPTVVQGMNFTGAVRK